MIKQRLLQLCFLLLLLQGFSAAAQEGQPFWNEISAFKKQDSVQAPSKDAILFVGSSSFRLWKDIDKAFPGYTIINRGFGGSSLPHVIRYADDIIFPYQPKQVVIYCGENDLTVKNVTGDTVYQRFRQLFSLVRERLPEAHLLFVSIKPSPSRWHLKGEMERANSLVKDFLEAQDNAVFVDVWHDMLGKDGNPIESLFVEDRLHMNAQGYAIWQKKIEPYLIK